MSEKKEWEYKHWISLVDHYSIRYRFHYMLTSNIRGDIQSPIDTKGFPGIPDGTAACFSGPEKLSALLVLILSLIKSLLHEPVF